MKFKQNMFNAPMWFKRVIIGMFIVMAVLGWSLSVQQDAKQNEVVNNLKKYHVMQYKIKKLSSKEQQLYLNFLQINKNKIITYKELLMKIKNGEYVNVDFVKLYPVKTSNSMYVIDVYGDKTQDYQNNTSLYDKELDTSNSKTFEGKNIIYRENKIILIKEINS